MFIGIFLFFNCKSMKTALITVLAIGIFVGGLILFAKKNTAAPPASSLQENKLTVEENSFDFGPISMANGKVRHSFKIKNPTVDSILIDKTYTSCMCTSASWIISGERVGSFGMLGHGFVPKTNREIKAGEEAELEVEFDPAAHGPAGVGKIDRVVYVETEGAKPLELKISANVTP